MFSHSTSPCSTRLPRLPTLMCPRQGFNMMYPFSSSDLTCSVAVLKNYMENAPSKASKRTPPWESSE